MRSIFLMAITALFFNLTSMSQEKVTRFVIHTDFGDMKGYLYNETPKHRDNFAKLAKEKYYDGLLFHRVIPQFMIQGGDPNSKTAKPGQQLGGGGPGYTVPAEFNNALIHKKGALAAARTGDQVNPTKASSGSQFYICQGKKYQAAQLDAMGQRSGLTYTDAQKKAYETLGGVPFLDGQYTVFGEITEGLEVIDKIAAVERDQSDRPKTDVKMTIRLVE